MKNKHIQAMTLSAMIIAIIVTMTCIPYVGYITVIPISITTIPLVVLVVAAIFDWKQALVAGIAFGLTSLVKASTMPGVDFFFVNPLISVLPRAIFGFLAGIVFHFIKKINNLLLKNVLTIISAGLLTALHTVMVLTMLYLFRNMLNSESFMSILQYVISLNAIIEIGASMVVTPIVITSMSKIQMNKKEASYE